MVTAGEPAACWSACVHGTPPRRREKCLVGVFDGEGSGPEVVRAALTVLEAVAAHGGPQVEIRRGGRIGCEAEEKDGESLTPEAVEFCRAVFADGGAVLHGAGGGRFVYELRRQFDLFCKISPASIFTGLHGTSRLKLDHLRGVDMVFVRENSGGVYQGVSRALEGGVVEHTFQYSEAQVRRIAGVSARLAASRSGRLSVVLKEGGLPGLSGMWRDCAGSAAAQAGAEVRFLNVDHAAYEIIQNPGSFDVVLTPNLFGDILVDLSAVLSGSRGLGYSGNFSDSAAVYQTNHGAAHDLAGRDEANPAGQILSVAMMLRESFARPDAAARIVRAMESVWALGWRTADVHAPGCRIAGTRKFGDLVAEAVHRG